MGKDGPSEKEERWTMKAITQNATYEFSKAKKVIASVVAAALVISFGNFAVAGTTQALADDNTVEVRFKVTAADTTVSVDDQTFGADAEGSYTAAVDADLSFTINAGENAPAVAVSYTTEGGMPVAHAAMGSKQPSDNLIIGESSLQDDSNDASDATDEESVAETEEPQEPEAADDSAMYVEQEVTPIPETAAILQEEGIEDDQVALASTGDTDAAEEVLEDEFPPMAAAPTAADEVDDEADEEEAVESVTVRADENGNYTIPAAALASAAERDAVIVVTVAAEEGVTSWSEVDEFLDKGEDGTVKLAADITEGVAPVTVHGNKTLDLNGYDIKAEMVQGSLFVVGKGNSLTITDTSEDAAAKEIEVTDPEFSGKKIPNPAENRGEGFEDMVGKTATYDAERKTLTYFVTGSYPDRLAKGQTEEYLFEHQLDLSGAGAIEVANGQRLVDVNGGELNIEGGRFTQTSGWHMITAHEGTVNMTGGFLVGARGDNGAAINAGYSTVNISGNAILAGNIATGENNGGAIFVDNTTLHIGGKAILAGNKAGENPYTTIDRGKMAKKNNGGAVYAESSSDITVDGNAIIAGNVAQADGGGIYLMGRLKTSSQKKSTLTLGGSSYITNNRSENDKSEIHFTERTHESSEVDWKNYGGGGGGVFSMDETIINGAKLTGNYASDGGGALLITGYANYNENGKWVSQYVFPLLQVENAVFASNYAGTSEGGAINAITRKDSYIKRGYITNNMTATPFDYGGGGLFLSSATQGTETGLTVIYPLVTNNTARGFGGGVGVCTNGIAVTADAAIFDNTALTDNATTNPNEFGDQWSYDDKYGLKEIVKRQEVDGVWQSLADDFYCAKESTVYNKMLGDDDSYYNWTGLTDGYVLPGSIFAVREGSASPENTLMIDGEVQPTPPNALYNAKEGKADLHIYDDGVARNFDGYGVTVQVNNINTDEFPSGTHFGVVTDTQREGPSGSKYPGFYGYKLTLDKNVRSGLTSSATLEGAYVKPDGSGATNYTMYNVEKMAEKTGAFVKGERLTLLKAKPDPTAKEAALAKAALFVTGNYSNTNGGGIACNDRIAIGRDPENPDIPDNPGNSEEPADKFGALQITKSLDKFSAANGTATALFKVTGYVDYDMAKNKIPEFVIYENTVGFTFGAGEGMSASEVLTDLPEGYYVIEELYYSGDNFDGTPNRALVKVPDEEAGSESVEVSFKNKYEPETYGSGVVNRYAPGENGFTYTPISPSTEEGR